MKNFRNFRRNGGGKDRGGRRPMSYGGGGYRSNNTTPSNNPHQLRRQRANWQNQYEKYMAMGKDQASAGDFIAAETYYQHAEHYIRQIAEIEPLLNEPAEADMDGGDDWGNEPNDMIAEPGPLPIDRGRANQASQHSSSVSAEVVYLDDGDDNGRNPASP